MTTIGEGLRKGRSHLIIAATLAIGGTLVVQIEDQTLNREAGKAIPQHKLAPTGGFPTLAAAPVRMPLPVASTRAAPEAKAPVATPPSLPATAPSPSRITGSSVQLGAFDSEGVAQERWRDFVRRVPELAALDHAVEAASTRRGTVYRLLAAAPDRAAARNACAAVRRTGGPCFVR